MNNEQIRLIAAVTLSAIILFTWQMFFAPKELTPISKPAQEVGLSQKADTSITTEQVSNQTNIINTNEIKSPVIEQKIIGEKSNFIIMTDLALKDAQNVYAKNTLLSTTGNEEPIEIYIVNNNQNEKLNFGTFNEGFEKIHQGEDRQNNIKITLKTDDSAKLYFSLHSTQSKKFLIKFKAKKHKENQKIRKFLVYNKDVKRIEVGDEEKIDGSIKWAGIDYDYHLLAMVFNEKIPAIQKINSNGEMVLEFVNETNNLDGYYIYQQKNYDQLVKAGDGLQGAVDFGMFAIVAVPILRGLQFFYKYLPNYGIAIILLTLVVRIILLPLNYKSFKSMKKMQEIQPEMNKLKEKFKDDPQRMQKETMELFKRAGANPLGGCLPLLLQLPIFFAFYQVLFSAVELVGAPFFGWIADLSAKDPFYVLPVLMTATMFIQQKFMPSPTTDPTQKKIMLFMPIVFGVIMKDLPAGLTLYIFISTLVGIIQQYVINKSK